MVQIDAQHGTDPASVAQAMANGEEVVLVVDGREMGRVVPLVRWTSAEKMMKIYEHPVSEKWAVELEEQRDAFGPPTDPWTR